MTHPHVAQPTPNRPAEAFACAVIDEQGREVPITEAMILQACRALDQDADREEPAQAAN